MLSSSAGHRVDTLPNQVVREVLSAIRLIDACDEGGAIAAAGPRIDAARSRGDLAERIVLDVDVDDRGAGALRPASTTCHGRLVCADVPATTSSVAARASAAHGIEVEPRLVVALVEPQHVRPRHPAAPRADQQRASRRRGPRRRFASRGTASGIGQRSRTQSRGARMSEMSPWIGYVCASGLPARRCSPSTFWVTSANRSPSACVAARRARACAAFGSAARHTPRRYRYQAHTSHGIRGTPRASRAPAGGIRARRRSSSLPCRGTSGSALGGHARARERDDVTRAVERGLAQAARTLARRQCYTFRHGSPASRARALPRAPGRATRTRPSSGRSRRRPGTSPVRRASRSRSRRRRRPAADHRGETLRATQPDFRTTSARPWQIPTLVAEAAPRHASRHHRRRRHREVRAPDPEGLEPVLFLTRRGEVIVAAVDPKDPFPPLSRAGRPLHRAGDQMPRVAPVSQARDHATPGRDAVGRGCDQHRRAAPAAARNRAACAEPRGQGARDPAERVAGVDLAQWVEPARRRRAIGERVDRERPDVAERGERRSARPRPRREPCALGGSAPAAPRSMPRKPPRGR